MRFRMLTMTPKKIAEICGGTYYGDRDLATKEITGVVTDNRQVTEGGMFVAIKGAKVDGNRFVPAAYERAEKGLYSGQRLPAGDQRYGSVLQDNMYLAYSRNYRKCWKDYDQRDVSVCALNTL